MSDSHSAKQGSRKPADVAKILRTLSATGATVGENETPPWTGKKPPHRFTASLLKQALSRRGDKISPPALSVKECWLRLVDIFGLQEIVTTPVANPESSLFPCIQSAIHRLKNNLSSGTPDSDLGLLLLYAANATRHTQDYYRIVIDFLVASGGLAYALDIWLRSQQCSVRLVCEWRDQRQHYRYELNDSVSALHLRDWLLTGSQMVRRLGYFLACCDEAAWECCMQRLKHTLPLLHISRQPLVLLLLAEEPQLTQQFVQSMPPEQLPLTAQLLVMVTRDSETLSALSRIDLMTQMSVWEAPWVIATLVRERGVQAASTLAWFTEQETVIGYLAKIGTPEAIRLLIQAAVKQKSVLRPLNKTLARWPQAALVALAELVAVSKIKLIQTLFDTQMQKTLNELPQIFSWLSGAAQKKVLNWLENYEETEQTAAPDNDLPDVLIHPPWLAKREQQAALPALSEIVRVEPLVNWLPGQKADWLALPLEMPAEQNHYLAEYRQKTVAEQAQRAKTQPPQAFIDYWLESGDSDGFFGLCFYFLSALPDEQALTLWNGLAHKKHTDAEYVMSRFELGALPGLIASFKIRPLQAIALIMPFGAMELAPLVAWNYCTQEKIRFQTREWLLSYPQQAAAGLLAAFFNPKDKYHNAAVTALRMLSEQGHHEAIMQVAARYQNKTVVQTLAERLRVSGLAQYPGKIHSLPDFWQPAGWRRPVLRDSRLPLPDAALQHLGTMLTFPHTEGIYAGLRQVQACCDTDSLANFVWDGFQAWINAGADAKEAWIFRALRLFHNNSTAYRLVPFILAWAKALQRARAKEGIDILAEIGTDVALCQINTVIQKSKPGYLPEHARLRLQEIAQARALTMEELEDCLVPDFGLDLRGEGMLNYGPRQFTVRLNPCLNPQLYRADGASIKALPKISHQDDEALAQAAAVYLSDLKKGTKIIAVQQANRLEMAMCQQRLWTPERFMTYLVQHPVMNRLAQRLVWGVFRVPQENDDAPVLEACFRCAEDGSFTNGADEPFTLPQQSDIRVGLPHSLQIPQPQLDEFRQLFVDYHIPELFPQLMRSIYAYSAQDIQEVWEERYKGRKVPSGRLLGLMNKGWQWGERDGYQHYGVEKANVAIMGFSPGIVVGSPGAEPEQTLQSLVLHSSLLSEDSKGGAELLRAIAISELMGDISRLFLPL